MQVLITRNEDVNGLFFSDDVGKVAMIRIVDPGMDFVSLEDRRRYDGVLEVRFHDYTPELFDDLNLWISSFKLMSDLDGELVAKFVLEHCDVDLLVIHCVEGRSRSVGVGLAVADFLGLSDESNRLRSVKRYCPNVHVYELVTSYLIKLSSGVSK